MARTRTAAYAPHRLCAIIDESVEAEAAIRELQDHGFEEKHIAVYTGERGAASLDQRAGRRGPLGRLTHSFTFMITDALTDEAIYEQAAAEGKYVICVLAPRADERDRAHEALRDHGGHLIDYFGRMTMTALDH